MKKPNVSWGLKNSKGLLKGPFSTQQIINMINSGEITGEESISRLPGQRWVLISTEPEFYDMLLKNLESVQQQSPSENDLHKTVVDIPNPDFRKDKTVLVDKHASKKSITSDETRIISPPIDNAETITNEPEVIELINLNQIKKITRLRENKILLLLTIIIPTAIILSFIFSTQKPLSKIHLQEPQLNTGSRLTKDEIFKKTKKAVGFISEHTTESYLRAQDSLVSVLEADPYQLESRALLCFVYKELWSYSYQDAQDIQTYNNVVMVARKAGGLNNPFSRFCEANRLITLGRIDEARGELQILAPLEHEEYKLEPLEHLLNAEVYEINRDYLYAKSYYEQCVDALPAWVKPLLSLAKIYYEENQDAKGYTYLKKILEMRPNHKSALILMGLFDYKYNKTDSAFQYLDSAIRQNALMNHQLEAQGLLIFSKIYLSKGDKKNALFYAQKGYKIDFGNQELKAILSRLSEKVDEGSAEQKASYFEFLGDEFFRKEDYLSAQAEYKTSFDLFPKRGTTAMKAAKSLWKIHQSADAVLWLEKAIKAESKLISAYILLSDYHAQKYNFVGATEILKKAVTVAPSSYEVYKGLALLEFRKFNWPQSITYAQLAMRAFDQDVDTYIILSEANLNLSTGIMGISKEETTRKENALNEAKLYLKRVLELDPSSAEVQVLRVKIAAQEFGTDYGIEELNILIRNYAFTTFYRLELAKLLMSQERYRDALNIYKQIVNIDNKSLEGYLGLGKVLRILGDNNEAIKALYQAAIIDSSDVEPLFQIGVLYFESNQLDKALTQFAKVREQNPYFPRVNYYYGKVALELGKFDEAEESANLEKKNNPKLADPYLLLGEIYESKRNYADCAQTYAKVISMEASPTSVYVKAARCYRLSGSFDIADNMLTIAYSKESGYADIYKERGALYHAQGDSNMAITAFNKYLDLSPNAPDRVQIEALISNLER